LKPLSIKSGKGRFRIVLGIGLGVLFLLHTASAVLAAPQFQAAGAENSGTGSVTVNWPAHAAGDVALLFVETTGGEVATLSTAAGFVQVAGSPQDTGAGADSTRLTVFWARATSSSMASPIIADPGNHVYARILTYRGVISAGNPWDVTGGGIKSTPSTVVTVTGVTTTVTDTLIVQAVAHGRDSNNPHFSGQANANLLNLTERGDSGSNAGNGGGFAVWDGVKVSAGATGNTTANITNSVVNAFLTIALREEPVVPVIYSHWRMDQTGWNGAANEVIDSGPAAAHGVASGLVTRPTTANASPAIAGSPGTCQYGVFNRSNKDYIALPAGYPNLMAAAGGFTITAWINVANAMLPGQRIMIDDQNNSTPGGWGFSVGETTASGAGGLRFFYRQAATFILDTVPIPSGQWLFVALSVRLAAGANASTATIYAYNTSGNLVTSTSGSFTWTAGGDGGPPSIGGETNASGENSNAFGFGGSIDEVRVYQQTLSQGTIEAIRSETRICEVLDHFSFTHAGSGVACDVHAITLTAHSSTHAPVSANGATVNLSTTNGRGSWTGIVSGGGVLTPGVAGSGLATYTFAAGSSAVQLSFRYANLPASSETFGFNAVSGPISETSGTANPSDDPSFTMAQAGFRFRNVTDSSATIPTQISGKPSNTGFNAVTIRLQAIRTDASTLDCAAAFPAAGVRNVEMGAECNSPSTCAGRQLTITNNAATTVLPTSADNSGSGASSYATVPLLFSAASEADIVMGYPDAGQMSVHARYDLDAAVAGYEMTGSSGTFVVRPFGLALRGTNINTPIAHANTATGTVLAAAGDNFTMTVAAYQWAAGEDVNNDGIPDDGVNITDNGTVPNFAGTATVAVSANLPGTASGTMGRGPTCASAATIALNGGTATANDWCYSEAGNVLLTAGVSNYIAAGVSVTGNSGLDGGGFGGYVGRFRPKRFAVSGASLTNRLAAACTPSSGFTYMDEGLALAFTLTAQNAQGGTTQNYTGSYARLDPSSGGSNNSKTAFGIGARNMAPFAALTARVGGGYVGSPPSWSGGVLDVTGSSAALVTVGRPVPDDPPDGPYAQVQFGIAPADSDGVQMAFFDLDVDNSGGNDHTVTGPTAVVRYGRLRLGAASGSQLLPLRLPVEAQYWNGTFFMTHADDSCTQLSAGNVGLGNYLGNLNAGETAVSVGTGRLQSGRGTIQLSAPGAANSGSVDVAVNLGAGANANACPALAPAATAGNKGYLRGRWCGGTATRDPAARARFGIRRSSDEAIYSRESTN